MEKEEERDIKIEMEREREREKTKMLNGTLGFCYVWIGLRTRRSAPPLLISLNENAWEERKRKKTKKEGEEREGEGNKKI